MSQKFLDDSTHDECIEAMRQGRTLDDHAGDKHVDTEYVGRQLQLPTVKPVQVQADASAFDLWSGDRLDGVL